MGIGENKISVLFFLTIIGSEIPISRQVGLGSEARATCLALQSALSLPRATSVVRG